MTLAVALSAALFVAQVPPAERVEAPLASLVVHIVDATTRAPLDGIDVVAAPDPESGSWHPGVVESKQLLQSDVTSPVRLAGSGRWFVRAKGHAWGLVDARAEALAERILELPRACELAIEASGVAAVDGAVVRIEELSGVVSLLTLPTQLDGRWQVDSLQPGRVRVRALLDFHRKPWYWHTVTLGEAVVELKPDRPARAEFTVAPRPAGLHADGTVDRTAIVMVPDGARRVRATGSGEMVFRHVKPTRHVDVAAMVEGDLEAGDPIELLEADGEESPDAFEGDTLIIESGWSSLFEELPDGSYDMQRTYRATIRDGEASLRVPYSCWLEFESLTLDGEELPVDFVEPACDTTPQPCEVRVRGASAGAGTLDVLLHVVDAETKEELTGVRMALECEFHHHGMPETVSHPGPIALRELLVTSAASPFRPPKPDPELDCGQFWVGAEGYSWERVTLESHANGERAVALRRAATLTIEVAGAPPAGSKIVVRPVSLREERIAEIEPWLAWLDEADEADFRPGDSREASRARALEHADRYRSHAWQQRPSFLGAPMVALQAQCGDSIVLDGIRPMSYVVSCEIGEWYTEPPALASAQVDVAAGQQHVLRLEVPVTQLPLAVPLGGTLHIDPAWGNDPVDLGLWPKRVPFTAARTEMRLPAAELQPVEEEPGTWRWNAGRRLPGDWEVIVERFGHRQVVVHSVTGTTAAHIDIGPPCDGIVRLRDETTGEPIAVTRLDWRRIVHEEMRHGVFQRVAVWPDPSTGALRFQAPSGAIEIHASTRTHGDVRGEFILAPGRRELELRARRTAVLELWLTCGGARLPYRATWRRLEVRDSSGALASPSLRSESNALELRFDRPGRYQLAFPQLPGFKAIVPQEVEVTFGGIATHVIEVAREE